MDSIYQLANEYSYPKLVQMLLKSRVLKFKELSKIKFENTKIPITFMRMEGDQLGIKYEYKHSLICKKTAWMA